MDIVYSVKACESNEELRYSLRSLRNIPHDRVFISGYMPSWVNPDTVTHISTEQSGSKYQNSNGNIYAALEDGRVSESFLLFNDDFFILRPIESMPSLYYRGTLDSFIEKFNGLGSGRYVEGARRTREILQGLNIDPLYSYELHVPVLYEKAKLAEIYSLRDELAPGENIHTRTLYGNYHHIEAEPIRDVKVYHRQSFDRAYRDMTFLSSSDYSFRHGDVGRHVRRIFPNASPYEKPNH